MHKGQNLSFCLAYLPSSGKLSPISSFPFGEIIVIRIFISHVKFQCGLVLLIRVFCSYQPVIAPAVRILRLWTLNLTSPIILNQILQIEILSKSFAFVFSQHIFLLQFSFYLI